MKEEKSETDHSFFYARRERSPEFANLKFQISNFKSSLYFDTTSQAPGWGAIKLGYRRGVEYLVEYAGARPAIGITAKAGTPKPLQGMQQ